MYLVSAAEMKRYDNYTIEEIGIPAMVLMERAALAVTREVCRECEKNEVTDRRQRIFVLAGMGNNGGDGLAVARLLSELGFFVEVKCVGDEAKASVQWKQQYAILKYCDDVKMVDVPTRSDYDCLVDALFGVGLTREVTGQYAAAIEEFNALEGRKVAVDIPSGIDTDTGAVLGVAVKADVTLTFGFCKKGLALYPGCEYMGKLKIADIGIREKSFAGKEPEVFTYTGPIEGLLPKRNPAGNKGTFGKVLLVAGSVNMAGAAILSGKAIYKMGAGMVKLISPEENRVIIQETLPEGLYGTAKDLRASLDWADVIVVGPGLGRGTDALACLQSVIEDSDKPLVIDADGLNLLAENEMLQQKLSARGAGGRVILLTPHVGELARLAGKSLAECKAGLESAAKSLARRFHAIVVAKDARTYVCAENNPIYLNTSGNSGMATAGSGDVLAGICGALLGQGMEGFAAACTAVYAHGKAGDAASHRLGEAGVLAGDLVEEIGKAWKSV